MWNWPGSAGCAPRPKSVSRSTPISSQTGPVQASSCSAAKASWPAGTGVWVVKTLWARTSLHRLVVARCPGHVSSRTRSIIMNAAWPSLACQTDGIDAHGPEHPHAADAEDPLLPEPKLGAAGVELVHQPAVVGVVRLEVGVEQVDRHPAHHDPPGPHVHRPAGGLHRGEARLPVGASHRHQRGEADVVLLVAVLLPPVEPEPLVEVALSCRTARRPPSARRDRSRPCSGRRPARRGRRSRSAPSCGARTRRRSRRPAGRSARDSAGRTRCRR